MYLCVYAAAGQILLDHQGDLEGDGVIELPQIQAGQLLGNGVTIVVRARESLVHGEG